MVLKEYQIDLNIEKSKKKQRDKERKFSHRTLRNTIIPFIRDEGFDKSVKYKKGAR